MAETVDVERGLRLRAIREERDETQEEFATVLTKAAKSLGLQIRYNGLDVSKRETARKALDVEDFAVVALVDPQRRGWLWVAFGQSVSVGDDAWELLSGRTRGSRRGGGRS